MMARGEMLAAMPSDPIVPMSGEITVDDSIWNVSQRRDDPDLP